MTNVDTRPPLSWRDRGISYKAPSGEALHPSRFTSDGKPVYTYLRTPTATDPFLTLTLKDNWRQPNVQWSRVPGGALRIQSETPIVAGESKVPFTLDIPTLRGERASFPLESGKFSVRQTREGLVPYTFLSPEVRENGRHLYRSPEGTSLSFVLDDPQQDSPPVLWRQLPGQEHGEFFMVPAFGQEVSRIYASSRTTVELLSEGKQNEFERDGSLVSVDNGLFHVRNGNHDVMYVGVEGKVDTVEAWGESIGREAHILITKPHYVTDLHLHGHTYIQTHDPRLNNRFIPEADVFGTVHVGNGKRVEFNNDRINGYEVGMTYDPKDETYSIRDYSLEDLRALDGRDRYRSGHVINLPRRRRTGESKGERKKTDEMAPEHRSETPPRGRVEVLESADLQGDYAWKHIVANFQAAGIYEPNKVDMKLAQILTYIANGTDKTPPRGLTTRMLTPEALKVLVERDRHPALDKLVTDILDNPEHNVRAYQHVSDMARIHADRGREVIAVVNEIINMDMPPEDPAISQLRNQMERHFYNTPRPIPLFSARDERRLRREKEQREQPKQNNSVPATTDELPRTTLGDVWTEIKNDIKKLRRKKAE